MAANYQLIKTLSDGRFHSGEELARDAGVSRAAIWKQICKIKTDTGLDIQSVRGRGYRLGRSIELLDKNKIERALSYTATEGISRLEILDRVDSTNSYLLEEAGKGVSHGHVCLAEHQLAGKGRRGRTWISPYGHNIYLSIYWCYPLDLQSLTGLSLAIGLAVAKVLRERGATGIGVKWPNDIVWGNRKLAGVLLEVMGEQGGASRMVLGLGLNIQMSQEHADQIDQPWVDLCSVPGTDHITRNSLAALLISRLIETLVQFNSPSGSNLLDDWKEYDVHFGKQVILGYGNKQILGTNCGIDESGALILRSEGKMRVFHGGEISLRGVE